MTQTTTATEPPPEAATGSIARLHPSEIVMNLLVAFLAPMFLGVAAGDVGLARAAAIETVMAYRARNLADLLAVAQIVGCGLAALGSLSLSMEDDISLSMTLRLRGNAIALNRSAQQNRRAITGDDPPAGQETTPANPEQTRVPIEPHDNGTADEIFLNDAAAEMLAAESRARLTIAERPKGQPKGQPKGRQSTPSPAEGPAPVDAGTSMPTIAEKRHREMWAIVMAKEASEIAASIPGLPPAERRVASIRAGMLGSTSHQLLTGVITTAP